MFTIIFQPHTHPQAVPRLATAHVVFDTPNSDVDRRSEFTMNFNREDLAGSATFRQPSGTTSVQASISSLANSVEFEASYTCHGDSGSYEVGRRTACRAPGKRFERKKGRREEGKKGNQIKFKT